MIQQMLLKTPNKIRISPTKEAHYYPFDKNIFQFVDLSQSAAY